MRLRRRITGMAAAVAMVANAHAQPLTPLEQDVEEAISGTWVMASALIEAPLHEQAVADALRRCMQSMFVFEDRELQALFPDMEFARGDLSIFRSGEILVIAQAGAATPQPRKVTAMQMQMESGHLVRFANNAFWDSPTRTWIELTFATTEWGDVVVGQLRAGRRPYTLLLVMRHNGGAGIYVKCGT